MVARFGLLAGLILALSGCGTLLPIIPAPQEVRRFEPEFVTGIPAETPLPPLRLEDRSVNEQIAMRVYRDNLRSVVNITTISAFRNRIGGVYPNAGGGSGFFHGTDGFIVTNYHVVRGAQRVVVTLYDGSNYPAEVVGADPELDIAILRIDPLGRALEPVRWGTNASLQIGQAVFALGNPFGLEGTLTAGLVSGLRRPFETESGFLVNNLIQTDAAINPGNSGGPLLDSEGLVIGMNVMIVSPTGANVGIGFALPAGEVRRIADQIIETGMVTRGWIEIAGVALDRDLARAAGIAVGRGLLVTKVVDGGNADEAGIRGGAEGRILQRGGYAIPVDGDVIVAVGEAEISSLATYLGALETTQPGQTVPVTLIRDGEDVVIDVKLVTRPSPRPE